MVNDNYVDVKNEKIPSEFIYYITNKNEFYKSDYIKESIDKDYISKRDYAFKLLKDKHYNQYKKEYDFYDKGYQLLFK